jgi:hypothetical protein
MLMERDLPGHVLCTVCEKFESRLSGDFEKDLTKYSLLSSKWNGMEELACVQAKGMLTIDSTFKNGLHVRRQHLDLLLRSATLGTKFGLPISILSQTRSHRMYGENALNVKLDLSARVVKSPDGQDHLFIRTQQSFEIDLHVDALKQIKPSEI